MSSAPIKSNDDGITSKVSTYVKSEISLMEKNHEKFWTRVFYGGVIAGIMIVAAVMGIPAANNLFPGEPYENLEFETDNFHVVVEVKTIFNNSTHLIRESEALQYTLNIKNKNNVPQIFKVHYTITHDGKNIENKVLTEPLTINATETDTAVIHTYFENSGINQVTIKVEMYDDDDNLLLKVIDEGKSSKVYRIHSESDYQNLFESSLIYRYLWIIIVPFLVLAVKHARDIAENK